MPVVPVHFDTDVATILRRSPEEDVFGFAEVGTGGCGVALEAVDGSSGEETTGEAVLCISWPFSQGEVIGSPS